jgi:integrase
MTPPESGGSRDRKRLEAAIDERVRLIDSGSYRRNTEFILREQFFDFLQTSPDIEEPPTYVDEVTVNHCRAYAEYLRETVHDQTEDLSAASASEKGPYYTTVRAFFSFCIDEEWTTSNPARPTRVRRVLPEDTTQPDRQFWTAEARNELLEHVDQQVQAGIGEPGSIRRKPEGVMLYRNRALVAALAFTGARGGEILSTPDDRLRNGLRWKNVDLDDGIITVLGKSRNWEPIGLSKRVYEYLERLKRVLQPTNEGWPVFPSNHSPKHSRIVRETLKKQGYSEQEREEILEGCTLWEVSYEHDIAPPALSVNGGRSLMQRLCESAGVDVDDEYLKPHGGRRRLGHEIYQVNPAKSQETLRHQNIGTTHESYRDEQARETAKSIEDIVEGAGGDK